MNVRIRADLDQIPAYVAGRSVAGATKLASNEVSAGPLPTVEEAIRRAATEVHRYPDNGCTKLVEALSRRLDVAPESLSIGCGSAALCQQLVQVMCTPDDEVVFPWRSFEAYPIITRVHGATPVPVALSDEHAIDLDALAGAITPATRLVFVCTPNNPTGTSLDRPALDRFLQQVPEHVLVVLDEAYREFVTDPEAPDGVEVTREHDNVVSLRTFSKAYGLAGLRVGYAVASERVTEALRKVCVPFSVNALGQVAALASLDAEDELKARCEEIGTERERVRRALLDSGYDPGVVPASQANFVWMALRDRAQAFNEHCMDNGVVVRAFTDEGVRVTIGSPQENDEFLAAAQSFQG
jgi:histidinol-phosphate aminotransferase